MHCMHWSYTSSAGPAFCTQDSVELATNTTLVYVPLDAHVAFFAPLFPEGILDLPVFDAVLLTQTNDKHNLVVQALADWLTVGPQATDDPRSSGSH